MRLLATRSSGIRNRSTGQATLRMAYEVIDSIDATFVSQLTGCAGLIFAGQFYDSQELVAPSTPLASPSSKVIDFTTSGESIFEEEKEVDIYRDTALRYAGYLVSLSSQRSLFASIIHHPYIRDIFLAFLLNTSPSSLQHHSLPYHSPLVFLQYMMIE